MTAPTVHPNSTGLPLMQNLAFATVANFTGLNGGSAFSSGKLVVALANDQSIASTAGFNPTMTVGSASQAMNFIISDSTQTNVVSLWYADIPSGITDTIQMTSSVGLFTNVGVNSWLLTNVALGTATVSSGSKILNAGTSFTVTVASSFCALFTLAVLNNGTTGGGTSAGLVQTTWTDMANNNSDMIIWSSAQFEQVCANTITAGSPLSFGFQPSTQTSTAWNFNTGYAVATFGPSTATVPTFFTPFDDANAIMNMAKIIEMVGY